jgi:hypothetical protein
MNLLALFLQSGPDPVAIRHLAMTILALIPLIILVGLVVIIVPFWFICKKAGFSPWLSLINIIPFGTLFLYYYLAFADWKVVPAPPEGFLPPTYPPQA